MTQKHILACDERGNKDWRSRARTFTLGGFAAPLSEHATLTSVWDNVKLQLCGSATVELKWSHFFPGHHQQNHPNPLMEKDPAQWPKLVLWALAELFSGSGPFPIVTVVRKDQVARQDVSEITSKGKQILSVPHVFAAVVGQFALYLSENEDSTGEIWFDQLGSPNEEAVLGDALARFITDSGHEKVQRIDPTINFLDSQQEPFIQIADFVSGVIWASNEDDDTFLLRNLEHYSRGGMRTYGIVILE